MARDVIITPASGLIDFQGSVGVSSATIELDSSGNLNIANPGGDLTLGDTSRDLYIGNGVANVDIIFEQDGEIRGLTGKTLTFGQSDSYISFAGDITSGLNVSGIVTALSFSGNASSATYATTAGVSTNVSGGTASVTQLNVSGVSTFQGNVYLGDNDRLMVGDSNDLQIYHDVNNSVIKDAGTGNLVLAGDNSVDIYNSNINEVRARFLNNGAVELYYDNSKKFETTGIGISVSNGASTSATIAGPAELIIDPAAVGDNTGLVRIKGDLYVDGTTTQINSTSLEIADFIVGIASTATTDLLADGAGIQIGPDNTFLYEYNGGTNPSLKSSENLNVASGKVYQIAETERLSSNTLSLGTGTTIHSPSSNVLSLGVGGKSNIRVENTGDVTLNLSSTFQDEGILKFGRQDEFDRSHFIRVYNSSTQASNYMKFDVHNGTFSTGGLADATTVMTLLGSGSVGIGTDNPGDDLHLYGEKTLLFGPNTSGKYLRIGADPSSSPSANTANIEVTNGNIHIDSDDGGSAVYLNFYGGTNGTVFGNGASGAIGAFTSNGILLVNTTSQTGTSDQKLQVTGGAYVSGNVGIGTETPTEKLDVPTEKLDVVGTVKATLFSGSGASLTNIPNGALDNSTVSYGGVTLSLGGSDATPAFNLQDATNYPYTSLTGITTSIVGDTTPQLGGDLDLNSNNITGTGNIDITGSLNVSGVSTFQGMYILVIMIY
jgi:hypothetical protein